MVERPESEKRVDDSEFMDIAKDPAQARILRKALERLAEGGAGDTLKEMAQEVLSGRVGLREASTISAYSDALVTGMQPFKEKWDQTSDSERQNLAAQGERHLEEERQEIAKEQREAQQGGRGARTGSKHGGKGWSL
ncbi:hypothetical protein [Streptomyces benahoarensis]|uniref:Uncharacterized protein n=2 Tax=Streptomyces TaxID=1883 RepID=A0A553ZN77_9ACTN|nr:hypothetical protein [Streptomyces benahoarensis]TSB25573.1 hypothetical protein FNJ62_12775 [Streptomyces benahoarensis]TSB42910.1 hypothetical protein FNZ23_07335 [Streptomyces benahoarensis]